MTKNKIKPVYGWAVIEKSPTDMWYVCLSRTQAIGLRDSWPEHELKIIKVIIKPA